MATHAINRTSPKGGPFIGTCMRCGQRGLPAKAALEPCDNPVNLTDDETVLLAIAGDEPFPRSGGQSDDSQSLCRVGKPMTRWIVPDAWESTLAAYERFGTDAVMQVRRLQLRHPSRARRVRDYLTSPRARPSVVIATVAVLIVSSVSAVFFVVQAMVIASCL